MRPWRRSAFAACLLLGLGAVLALALGTLHLETAGGAQGYSTPVAVVLMAVVGVSLLPLSYGRATDAGASPLGAWAAVVGTVVFAPFVTLALLGLPSVSRPAPSVPGRSCPGWLVLLALPVGAAAGGVLLLLVLAFFRSF